jgi:hypothetical protein
MLDPPGLWIELLKFLLGGCYGLTVAIEENRSGAGRSLIECEYVFAAHSILQTVIFGRQ